MSYFFVYDVASEKKTELNGEKGYLSREYGPVVSISMQFTESSKPYSPEVPEKNVLDHRPTRLAKWFQICLFGNDLWRWDWQPETRLVRAETRNPKVSRFLVPAVPRNALSDWLSTTNQRCLGSGPISTITSTLSNDKLTNVYPVLSISREYLTFNILTRFHRFLSSLSDHFCWWFSRLHTIISLILTIGQLLCLLKGEHERGKFT